MEVVWWLRMPNVGSGKSGGDVTMADDGGQSDCAIPVEDWYMLRIAEERMLMYFDEIDDVVQWQYDGETWWKVGGEWDSIFIRSWFELWEMICQIVWDTNRVQVSPKGVASSVDIGITNLCKAPLWPMSAFITEGSGVEFRGENCHPVQSSTQDNVDPEVVWSLTWGFSAHARFYFEWLKPEGKVV